MAKITISNYPDSETVDFVISDNGKDTALSMSHNTLIYLLAGGSAGPKEGAEDEGQLDIASR